MTLGEKLLWRELRKLDLHIRRQAPIGRFIADFAHHGSRVAIEVDSPWHDDDGTQLRDAERDAWLAGQGYHVLRIRDRDILRDAESVAVEVEGEIRRRIKLPRASTPKGEPFPSMGKGRVGVDARASPQRALDGAGANLRPAVTQPESTPSPAPSLLRGRGGGAD